MCGLICYSGNFSKDNFLEGLSEISHRGPDDKGYFIDDEKFIGLGHTRLSIQDLSSKRSPTYDKPVWKHSLDLQWRNLQFFRTEKNSRKKRIYL